MSGERCKLFQKNSEEEGIYSIKRLNHSVSLIKNIRYGYHAPTPRLANGENMEKSLVDDNNNNNNNNNSSSSSNNNTTKSTEIDHPKHRLDIYFPNNHNNNNDDNNIPSSDSLSSVPIILKVHGGGWARGDRQIEWRGSPSFGRAMAKKGYIVAAISYRLAPPSYLHIGLRSTFGSLLLSLIAYFSLRFSSAFFQNISFSIEFPSLFGIFWLLLFSILTVYFFFFPYLLKRSNYARYPNQNLDVLEALIFIRKNIKKLIPFADDKNIFLAGHSAGGNLVSLLGLNYKQYFNEREKLLKNNSKSNNNNNNNNHSDNFSTVIPDHSSDDSILSSSSFPDIVKGIITISGVYNLHHPFSASPSAIKNFLFRLFYAHSAFGVTDSILNQASPYWHVKQLQEKTGSHNRNSTINNSEEKQHLSQNEEKKSLNNDVIPFLVFSASQDLGLEYDAQQFVDALKQSGINHRFELIGGTTHSTIASRFEKNGGAEIVKTFIDDILHNNKYREINHD